MTTEHALRSKVSRWLGQQDLWYMKVHGGRFQRPGIPDYILCVHGRFVALELKLEDTELEPLQRVERRRIEAAGGTYHVCRSLEEVRTTVTLELENE